jgi:hypothetical protein
MVEIATVGLLHRRKRIKIQQLKTAPQNARRQVLFAQVPLTALATALGVEAADLVQTAPTGAEAGIQAFAAMVAASGRAEEQRALLTAMLDDPECPLAGARPGYQILHAHLLAAELERPAQAALTAGLAALGLLADAKAAQSLIDICIKAGLSAADPKLDALQLNAALTPETQI